MYIDGVILLSLLVIVLTAAVVVYLTYYTRKQIKKDLLNAQSESLTGAARDLGVAE